MEQLTVRWHGHACFSLTFRDFTVVLDPYEDHYVPGFPPLRLTGDLVLCSHQHNDHNAAEIVSPHRPPQPLPYHQNSHLPRPGRGAGCGGRTPSICWRWASCGWPISGTWAVPSLPRKGRAPGPGRGHAVPVGGFYHWSPGGQGPAGRSSAQGLSAHALPDGRRGGPAGGGPGGGFSVPGGELCILPHRHPLP